MKAEHAALQERLSKLNRAISQLIVQRKWLRYALQRANEERPALESIVKKYKSKLNDEVDGAGVAQLPPSIDSTYRQVETPLVPSSQVATQAGTALKPTVTTPAASADPTTSNPRSPSGNRETSEPVKDDWLSMLKGWAISLWRSIFS